MGTTRRRTFREANHELLRVWLRADDFLPAIAVFMPGDSREYSPLFEPVRQRRDYVSDHHRFALLFSADNGKTEVYNIRSEADEDPDTAP